MARIVILVLGAMCVFAGVAAVMLRLMPAPFKDSDYVVIGSVATLVSLLVLFFGLAPRASRDVFVKRRKKK